MIVAIDGPAGCGKSTVAKAVAKELGFYFLNTGSFYRAVTLAHIERGGDCHDKAACLETARSVSITVRDGDICLDGVDVEDRLHVPAVDMNASIVSSDPALRAVVTDMIRQVAGHMDIVTEGRDTATVIFPDAQAKFYFDADLSVRAARRALQEGGGSDISEVERLIKARDENDKNKPVGALKAAPDAIIIDTSHLTIREVCEKVVSVVRSLQEGVHGEVIG